MTPSSLRLSHISESSPSFLPSSPQCSSVRTRNLGTLVLKSRSLLRPGAGAACQSTRPACVRPTGQVPASVHLSRNISTGCHELRTQCMEKKACSPKGNGNRFTYFDIVLQDVTCGSRLVWLSMCCHESSHAYERRQLCERSDRRWHHRGN